MPSNNEVLWVAKFDYQQGYGIKPHRHNYYQIIYLTHGQAEFAVNGDIYCLGSNMGLFLKPNEEHSMKIIEEGIVKTIDIKFVLRNNVFIESANRLDRMITCPDSSIPHLLEKIRVEGKEKKHMYKEATSAYLSELIIKMSRRQMLNGGWQQGSSMRPDGDVSKEYKAMVDYVRKHYNQKISLDDFASHLGYNKNYLCLKFKKEMGITIGEYIKRYRIQKAKELMKFSDYALKQICQMVGFESIHYFSKVFKAYEGISPGSYKE
ncbi:MAG: AraC family transcriptional regulator, partial [Mahellales bacterium]